MITLNSEDNFTYYLSYLNNITHELTDSDNASVVTSALNNLPTVQSFGRVVVYINVTTDIDTELELSIIFISDQKDLVDFKVIKQSNHASFVLQDFTQPTHFNLSLCSSHTNSMPIHESATNIASELLTLFTTTCHITGAVQPNSIFVDTVTVSSTSPTTDLICYDIENPLSCNLIVSRYVVEFKVHQCGYNMPLLSSSPNNVLVSRLYSGTPAVNGTFQLTFENQTVYNIPANVLASELKTLLETYLPNEGGFEVTRTGDCSGYIWNIKWTSRGGDLPLMLANGSGLSGHMVNISVVPIVNGGVWLRPFRGDMLRLPELKPQVDNSIFNIIL